MAMIYNEVHSRNDNLEAHGDSIDSVSDKLEDNKVLSEENPIISSVVVVQINSDVDKFDWDQYTDVTLTRCLQSIIPERLAKSKLTLTHLTFSDFSLFKNIKRCLKTFPNISTLKFSNVIIDAYHRFLYTKVIDAPSVKRLTIERRTKLTNSEYFLMDFFLRGASLINLNEFQLIEHEPEPVAESEQAEQNFGRSISICVDKDKDRNGSDISDLIEEETTKLESETETETPFLARFLAKHYSSLKKLKIQGRHIKVLENSSTSTRPQNLKLVQLDEFVYSMDDPGQDYILEHQNHLKVLNCEGLVHNFSYGKLFPLLKCIENNYDSLTSVRISPTILTLADIDNDNDVLETESESDEASEPAAIPAQVLTLTHEETEVDINNNNPKDSPAEPERETSTTSENENDKQEDDNDDDVKNENAVFIINCRVFKKIKNLKTLELNLKLENLKNTTIESEISKRGTTQQITNLCTLPRSIQHLSLVSDGLRSEDVQFLTDRLVEFQDLETFYLKNECIKNESEDENKHFLEIESSLDCLRNLCRLPKIKNMTVIPSIRNPSDSKLQLLLSLLQEEIMNSKVKICLDGIAIHGKVEL